MANASAMVKSSVSNDNRHDCSILAPVNRVSLFGRLVADPDTKVTCRGRWIVHLLLETEQTDAEDACHPMQDETGLNRVVVVDDRLSRLAGTRLCKGQRILVEGQLQTRSSVDEYGHPLIATEIVLSGRQARLELLDRQITRLT